MDKSYKLEDNTYFHFHTNEEGYYYSIYDRNGEETDGGLMEYDPDIDEPNESLESVLDRLSSFSGITNLKQAKEIPFEEIENTNYKDIVLEYAKRNNVKLKEYDGKIIDITEYLYAYPDISEENIDLSEDNDYFAIYDSYEQFYNENEEYFEEDEEMGKLEEIDEREVLGKENLYKSVCQKYINTMEKEMLLEKDGDILRIFIKDEYIDLKHDGRINEENYKNYLENEFPVVGYNSYEELFSNDLKYHIKNDIEELGLYDEDNKWNFYLTPEEVGKIGFGNIEIEDWIKNFLIDEVDKLCDKEGNYIPETSEEEILRYFNLGDAIIENDLKSIEDFYDLMEKNYYDEFYDEFKSQVLDDLNEIIDEGNELDNEFWEKVREEVEDDFWDLIEDTNFNNNIAIDMDRILEKANVKVNLLLATPNEVDNNYRGIDITFKNKLDKDYFKPILADNALSYLIVQQGYNIKDVKSCLNKNPEGFPPTDYKLPFIESVADELASNPDYGNSKLTVLLNLNGKEILNLIENKEKNIESTITVSKDTMLGLYDELNRCRFYFRN